jgi:hypothetical protein
MSPSHHPTILIGYGAYGLQVMRNFLAGAAARGALVWDDDGIGSLNERRLRSLSLLWVPDTLGLPGQRAPNDLLAESGYELMDDLYAQVEEVEGTFDEIRVALADIVDREKKRLLDARLRTESNIPGLDVILLAQPTGEEIIGSVRDLMEPAMQRLQSDPVFRTVQEGGGDTLLNFIQMLDFEEYWATRMAPVRAALQQVLRENEEAFASGRPTVGRVYLFDGNTPGGHRSFESRLQEVVLFLELLLLEGLRNAPDARVFYRRERVSVPPVCTIGVRVVERSSGLLRRLAAAAFARSWLAHISSSSRQEIVPGPFEELVSPFRPDKITGTVGEPALLAAAQREIEAVGSALLTVSPEQPDWGERLRQTATSRTEAAIQRLSLLSGTQSASLGLGALMHFREELERTVTAAMQERSPAFTLGGVIEELRRLEAEFIQAINESEPSADTTAQADDVFDEAGRMQREYVMYRARQVQTARLRVQWWTRAAVMFALALSPLALRAIAEAWTTNPIPVWVQALLCSGVLGGVFWWIGHQSIHPVLGRTAERAREYYTHPERGRLFERVRQIVGSPAVAGRIHNYSRLLSYGLRQYVSGAVAAELKRARGILLKRREEVDWLQRQIGEFLVSYQVDASGQLPVFHQGRVSGSVRFSLERSEDLEAVAQSAPRGVDRFRELVSARRLFAGWSQPFCDTFLHPLPFLDQLSESFQDRLEMDDSESRRRASRISAFLEQDVQMGVCFLWLKAGGLPSPVRGSLFPSVWNSFPGVRMALSTSGFGARVVETANAERLYLFESVLGVPTELLVMSQ